MKLHFIRGDFMIREELDRLLCDAKSNAELKEKLLNRAKIRLTSSVPSAGRTGTKSVQANFLHSDLTKATPSFAV